MVSTWMGEHQAIFRAASQISKSITYWKRSMENHFCLVVKKAVLVVSLSSSVDFDWDMFSYFTVCVYAILKTWSI